MSRSRSCVSQVKPSPMMWSVTRSGNFASSCARRCPTTALDELHDADGHAMADVAEHHAERGGDLALAVAGVDDQQALFDGLGRHDLVARRLVLAHLLGDGWRCSASSVLRDSVMRCSFCGLSEQLRDQVGGTVRARRPQAATDRLAEARGDLAERRRIGRRHEGAHPLVLQIGGEQLIEMMVRAPRRWSPRSRTGSRPWRRSRRRPCSRGASRRRSISDWRRARAPRGRSPARAIATPEPRGAR